MPKKTERGQQLERLAASKSAKKLRHDAEILPWNGIVFIIYRSHQIKCRLSIPRQVKYLWWFSSQKRPCIRRWHRQRLCHLGPWRTWKWRWWAAYSVKQQQWWREASSCMERQRHRLHTKAVSKRITMDRISQEKKEWNWLLWVLKSILSIHYNTV